MRSSRWVLVSLVAVPGLLVACGSAPEATESPREVPTETGAGGGDATTTAATTAAATTGAGGEGGGGPEVCPAATGVYEPEPAPSNVLFLLDRSGSMHLRIDESNTRWLAMKAGLFTLLDGMDSSVNAGIEMFPRGDAPIDCCVITESNVIDCGGCAAGELPGPEARCDASWYTTPPVPVSSLDAEQRATMKDFVSTADTQFYWGTPLAPALEGAVASQIDALAPGVTSVILLTDGNPTSCDTPEDPGANDVQRVIDAAAAGLAAPNPVRTFVVGVVDGDNAANGASEANISRVAAAGGTARYEGCEAADDCAYPVNVDNFHDELAHALDDIARKAFGCSFELPEVEGGAPDYDAVNITLTAEGATTTVPRDTGHTDGWDYLPGNEQIQLYGAACDVLREDASAKIEVVVGCTTIGD